jgi:hypothetical protein
MERNLASTSIAGTEEHRSSPKRSTPNNRLIDSGFRLG